MQKSIAISPFYLYSHREESGCAALQSSGLCELDWKAKLKQFKEMVIIGEGCLCEEWVGCRDHRDYVFLLRL